MFSKQRAQLRPRHGTTRSEAAEEHAALLRRRIADTTHSVKTYFLRSGGGGDAKKKLLILFSIVLFTYITFPSLTRKRSSKKGTLEWVKMPIVDIERPCPAPEYPVVGDDDKSAAGNKICITTLTDEKKADSWQRLVRWRTFDNLLGMTWPNKQAYADKHGYHLFDGSDLLDTSRPPSWSKILAVRRLLTEESCDWVFWVDADTVIMNSDKKVESFLPTSQATQDFIITPHTKGATHGYNAGVWLIRNSEWSLQFLDHWWGMTDFVRRKGIALSGDNTALNAYLQSMEEDHFNQHVLVPPKCHFNSVSQVLSPEEAAAIERDGTLEQQRWYMHENHYHKGDLIAHVAGADNKIDPIAMLLEHAT